MINDSKTDSASLLGCGFAGWSKQLLRSRARALPDSMVLSDDKASCRL
jgi:hypothetical protein